VAKKTVATASADPTVRYTKVELNGAVYSLAYDFESIAIAEDLTGMEILIGVNWSKINARRLRAMLFASLLKAQPEITLEETGKLITVGNLSRIEAGLVDSWMRSNPDPADEPTPTEPEQTPA
jgi:hypothetical protein